MLLLFVDSGWVDEASVNGEQNTLQEFNFLHSPVARLGDHERHGRIVEDVVAFERVGHHFVTGIRL